jgi:hypothetical protein
MRKQKKYISPNSDRYTCARCGKDLRYACKCNHSHPVNYSKSGEGIIRVEKEYRGYK